MVKCLFGLLLAVGAVCAQNAPKPQAPAQTLTQSKAQKEAKKRLGLLATRAIANFKSADTVEANLNRRGQSMHPELVALRLKIEAALDEAQLAVDRGDADEANLALDNAQSLLERFAQRLGGA